LPSRVIDVQSVEPFLYETRREPGRYICLSHCWGNVRPACSTKKSTIEANKRGINSAGIPNTFKDAIDFTRRLGIRYIRIDSICIIQDDPAGWAVESTQMADVYASAYLTICATASADDDAGCYRTKPAGWAAQSMEVAKADGFEYDIYVRYGLQREHVYTWGYAISDDKEAKLMPLIHRAWAYQERTLSHRLVHFQKAELKWECSELTTCECSPGHVGRKTEKLAYTE
jgi:hypothetical protein